MRTAQEMYNYCMENKLGGGSKKWLMKSFKVIENNLTSGEDVKLAFAGISNYKSFKENEGMHVYAITTKRIMRGRKEPLFGETFSSISLEYLNDVHFETQTGSGMLMNGIITFDTMKETFNVNGAENEMQKLFNDIQELMLDSTIGEVKPEENKDPVDMIRKFKELLDEGIITEDEFNIKKEELLKL